MNAKKNLELLATSVGQAIRKGNIKLAEKMIDDYIVDPDSILPKQPVKVKEVKVKKQKIYTKEDVITMLRKNISIEDIAAKTGFTKNSVVAYKAHLTMGRYQ